MEIEEIRKQYEKETYTILFDKQDYDGYYSWLESKYVNQQSQLKQKDEEIERVNKSLKFEENARGLMADRIADLLEDKGKLKEREKKIIYSWWFNSTEKLVMNFYEFSKKVKTELKTDN